MILFVGEPPGGPLTPRLLGHRWKEHGVSVDVAFDVSDGSRCWELVKQYFRTRSPDRGQPKKEGRLWPISDHRMAGPRWPAKEAWGA